MKDDPLVLDDQTLRDRAWIGDAILCLYAREWILKNEMSPGVQRGQIFTWFTSNQFLSCIGEPTKVEAKIGTIYQTEGLQAAFHYISVQLLPLFLKQLNNRNQKSKAR